MPSSDTSAVFIQTTTTAPPTPPPVKQPTTTSRFKQKKDPVDNEPLNLDILKNFQLVQRRRILKRKEIYPRNKARLLMLHVRDNPDFLLNKKIDKYEAEQRGLPDPECYKYYVLNLLLEVASSENEIYEREVVYKNDSHHKCGRLIVSYDDKKISYQGLCRSIRDTLAEDFYDNYDGENQHQYQSKYTFDAFGRPSFAITEYITDRNKIIKECIDEAKWASVVNREFVKVNGYLCSLYLREELHHPLEKKAPDKCIKFFRYVGSYKDEVQSNVKWWVSETDVGKSFENLIIEKRKAVKSHKKDKNIFGAAFSLYNQEIESRCVSSWENALRENYKTELGDNFEFDVFMHDGWMSLKSRGVITQRMLEHARFKAKKEVGVDIPVLNKPLEDAIKFTPEQIETVDDDWKAVDWVKFIEDFKRRNGAVDENDNVKLLNIVGVDKQIIRERDDIAKKHYIIMHDNQLKFAAELCEDLIKAKLILPAKAPKEIYIREYGDNLWSESEEATQGLRSILTKMSNNNRILKEVISVKNDEIIHIPIKTPNEISSLATAVVDIMGYYKRPQKGGEFDKITDETTGKVFYKNGYWDLEKRRFISSEEDPIASTFVRIESDFNEKDILWMELCEKKENHPVIIELYDKLFSIFGDTKQQKDFPLKCIARALGGHIGEKVWYLMQGFRNSGKGSFEKMVCDTFEGYCTNFSQPVKKDMTDPAANNREVLSAKLYKSRIAFSNESSSDKGSISTLDGNFIKNSASGGDYMLARCMRQNEILVRCTAKLFMNVNEAPPCDPVDALDTGIVIPFPNKYEMPSKYQSGLPTVKLADPSIKDKINRRKDWRLAFTWLIFHFWSDESVMSLEIPNEVVEAKEVAFGADGVRGGKDLVGIFGRKFIIDKDADPLPVDEIYKAFKTGETEGRYTNPDITKSDEMRYASFLTKQKIFEKKQKRVQGKVKYFWTGLKHRVEEEEE